MSAPFQIPTQPTKVTNPDGSPTDAYRRFFLSLAQRLGSSIATDGFVSTSGTFYPVTSLLNVTGALQPFAGNGVSVPSGWLLCDGRAVNRTTYADLFTVLGTIWGAGDNITTFNLPNFAKNPGVPWNSASALLPILAQINWIVKT